MPYLILPYLDLLLGPGFQGLSVVYLKYAFLISHHLYVAGDIYILKINKEKQRKIIFEEIKFKNVYQST